MWRSLARHQGIRRWIDNAFNEHISRLLLNDLQATITAAIAIELHSIAVDTNMERLEVMLSKTA